MNKRLLAAIEAVLATGNGDIYYDSSFDDGDEPSSNTIMRDEHLQAIEELRAAHQAATTFQDRSVHERIRTSPELKEYHDAHGFTQHDRERDIAAISKMAEELR